MRAATEDTQTRAGMIASEFSLCGLGAGLLVCSSLLLMMPRHGEVPVGRETALVAAGLLTLGSLAAISGWVFDLGAQRTRAPGLRRTLPAVAGLGVIAAVGAIVAALLPWPLASHPQDPGQGPVLMFWLGVTVAPLLLAAHGLRALAALPGLAPLPLIQLFQAVAHTILSGAAVLLVLAAAADRLTLGGHVDLAAAIGTLAAHAFFWAAMLLRSSRRALLRARGAGVRLPLIERGHLLASAAAYIGLLLPILVVLNVLLTGRETGLLAACAVAAASNHVMRYAWATMGYVAETAPR